MNVSVDTVCGSGFTGGVTMVAPDNSVWSLIHVVIPVVPTVG